MDTAPTCRFNHALECNVAQKSSSHLAFFVVICYYSYVPMFNRYLDIIQFLVEATLW